MSPQTNMIPGQWITDGTDTIGRGKVSITTPFPLRPALVAVVLFVWKKHVMTPP